MIEYWIKQSMKLHLDCSLLHSKRARNLCSTSTIDNTTVSHEVPYNAESVV